LTPTHNVVTASQGETSGSSRITCGSLPSERALRGVLLIFVNDVSFSGLVPIEDAGVPSAIFGSWLWSSVEAVDATDCWSSASSSSYCSLRSFSSRVVVSRPISHLTVVSKDDKPGAGVERTSWLGSLCAENFAPLTPSGRGSLLRKNNAPTAQYVKPARQC